jgi:hypothetical protein
MHDGKKDDAVMSCYCAIFKLIQLMHCFRNPRIEKNETDNDIQVRIFHNTR